MVFIIKKPTPQRSPTFDALFDQGVNLLVIYLTPDASKHGWGALRLHHPHVFVEDNWLGALRVLPLLVRRHVEVIGVFGYRGPVRSSAAIFSRLTRRKVVTRSDSNIAQLRGEPGWKSALRRIYVRAVMPRYAQVWTIGESNEQYWSEYLGFADCVRIPYEVPVLPNSMGVSPSHRSTDPDRVGVLFVGRLDPVKRVPDLIRAFRGLPESTRNWRLDIVGDGPQRALVEEMSESDSRIRVVGAVEYHKLDAYYQSADVLVLPSGREPWGLVVNEALGFGLWVVVSDDVGAKQLVSVPEVGMVFPTGNVERLRRLLLEVINFPERRPMRPATDSADLMSRQLSELAGTQT